MSAFHCSGESAAHDAGAHDMTACADCHRHFPGGSMRVYPHGNVCEECHDERQDSGVTAEQFGRSPREPRKAAGAFRTFYHFRSPPNRIATTDAHAIIRRWCYEVRSQFAPNPLCMSTRKHLTEIYDRPGNNTGD